MTSAQIQRLAHECGFEIAGVTPALPHDDFARFEQWAHAGKAAGLHYLTDHRTALRADPRSLLPSAKSIICLGKLYNTEQPFSHEACGEGRGWISRYAWGLDYHDVLRPALENLAHRLAEWRGAAFESRICIDTAPLLERSYARAAGLGWIGKNTCLINERRGSWFFLAELLVDFPIPPDHPPPHRCGACTRCIDACPTRAIVPDELGGYSLDAGLCISYLTIEKRGTTVDASAAQHGAHLFGCDICQDVCPWNQRAHRQASDVTEDRAFAARIFAPDLAELAQLSEWEFRERFRHTPIWRAKYEGFLRNVAIAMGNSGKRDLCEPLARLARHPHPTVSETARAAMDRLNSCIKLSESVDEGYYR